MRSAKAGMVASTNRAAFTDHHRAYHRVRFNGAAAFLGLGQGRLHPKKVFSAHAGSVLSGFLEGSSRGRRPGGVRLGLGTGAGAGGTGPRLTAGAGGGF